MELKWHGHSCFTVSHEGYAVVLDPYRMEEFPPLSLHANEVICSHEHYDHNARDVVALSPGVSPFTVETIDTFHDTVQGKKRGTNRITILSCGDFRLAHCGDLGHALSEVQLARLRGADALLLPVGGVYTIDAAGARALCDAVKPRWIVPMHYRGASFGLHNIETVELFLALFAQVHRMESDTLVFAPGLPQGVYVPQYQEKRR